MPTVLIVDDFAPFRALARRVLTRGGYNVVADAHDGASAIARAAEIRPDVILLDVNLPDSDGFTLASVLTRGQDAPVVVLTSTRDRRDLEPMLRRSAAHGFVAKDELSPAAIAELLN